MSVGCTTAGALVDGGYIPDDVGLADVGQRLLAEVFVHVFLQLALIVPPRALPGHCVRQVNFLGKLLEGELAVLPLPLPDRVEPFRQHCFVRVTYLTGVLDTDRREFSDLESFLAPARKVALVEHLAARKIAVDQLQTYADHIRILGLIDGGVVFWMEEILDTTFGEWEFTADNFFVFISCFQHGISHQEIQSEEC